MMKLLVFALFSIVRPEGSGQGQAKGSEAVTVPYGYSDYGDLYHFARGFYDDYEEADLESFQRSGSTLTTCRVGVYNTRNSPFASTTCAEGEVCQVTFVYRREVGAFKRFYRAFCKKQKTCEVIIIIL